MLGSLITKEADEAAYVKNELPIMVVLGNPPYSGHSANDSFATRHDSKGQETVQGTGTGSVPSCCQTRDD